MIDDIKYEQWIEKLNEIIKRIEKLEKKVIINPIELVENFNKLQEEIAELRNRFFQLKNNELDNLGSNLKREITNFLITDIAELREDIEILHQCDAKDTKNFNELKELLNCEVMSRKIKIEELREDISNIKDGIFNNGKCYNELREELNKLKQLIPMEWQQKHNTKQIINLENILQESINYISNKLWVRGIFSEKDFNKMKEYKMKLDGKDEDHVECETDTSRRHVCTNTVDLSNHVCRFENELMVGEHIVCIYCGKEKDSDKDISRCYECQKHSNYYMMICEDCYKKREEEKASKSENSWSISSKMGGESNLDASPIDSKLSEPIDYEQLLSDEVDKLLQGHLFRYSTVKRLLEKQR